MWRRSEPLGPGPLQELLTRWFERPRVIACLGAWENFVYRVGDGDGRAWVLRVTEGSRRRAGEIGAELAWLEAIAKAGHRAVVVPAVRPSRAGALVETVETATGPHHAVVFEQLDGTKVTRAQCRAAPAESWRAWGRAVAATHLAAPLDLSCAAGAARRRWDEDRWLDHVQGGADTEPQVHRFVADLQSAVARAMPPEEDFGLVHGDIHARNVLIQPSGRLALFDFDDACLHWRAYDLAVTLTDAFDHLQAPEALAARTQLVAGYRSVRSLDDRSVGYLDLLARWRQALDYLHYRHAVSSLSGRDRRVAATRVDQLWTRLTSAVDRVDDSADLAGR